MSRERLLLDTAFVQALLNRYDQRHLQALALLPRVRSASEVWVTEAVLIEVADAMSRIDRIGAVEWIRGCYRTPNTRVVPIRQDLLGRSMDLYESRLDKTWGLTDCLSFIVMQDERLHLALTSDRHFVQAGFRALMLEES